MTDWTPTQRYASTHGAVRWDTMGRGAPVVLLHGTPFSSYIWRDLATRLAAHHQVFVWDMPGYGASDKHPGQDVSLAAQGEVFAELLAHWGLQRPQVVAHDFGGAVALRAHLLHGARFDRLVLANAVALSPWGSPFFWLAHDHNEAFTQIPAYMHQAMVQAYIASGSVAGLSGEVLEGLTAPWLGEQGQAAFYRQIAQGEQRYTDEIAHRLGELQLPVLVFWGEQDPLLSPQRARELAARIPDAQLHIAAGAGHLVQYDAPDELAAQVEQFLVRAD